MKDVLCVILGGGRGTRLYPLTKYRAKPAVPICGKYRLVDVPISNCLNSGLSKIVILTQFNSASLNRHIFRAYKFDFFSDGFVEILAADQSMEHADWFQGSADAVRKSFKHFSDPRIKYILVLSGDQLYRMDFSQLLASHLEKKADITIACSPVERKETSELGIMGIDRNSRIKTFIEKPKKSDDIDSLAVEVGGKERFLASTGIYLFNKDVLAALLLDNQKVDFGKEIIPEALFRAKTHAFVFEGYWKDIGSIQAFYEENLAFADDQPPLDFFDANWPFFTRPRHLPLSRFKDCRIERAAIAEGAVINGAKITHSVVGLRSRIGQDTVVEDSILMGNDYFDPGESYSAKAAPHQPALGIGKNCHILKSIVDKNCRIGDNVKITNKKGLEEFENEYCVIRHGITIIPKGTVIPSGTVI